LGTYPPRPRRAQVWRHRAALCGVPRQSPNRPIARRIQRRRERPEPLRVRRFRCGESAGECGGRVFAAVCCAGARRCTMPRTMARPTISPSSCCAAPTEPSRPSTGNASLRRTAEPKPQQPRARRDTPKQVAEEYGKLADYEAGERQVQPARCLTVAAPPRPQLVPSVLAVGARRSSGQGGDAALSLQQTPSPRASSCTVAPAGRSVEHVARAAALIGSAKCARARSTVPRTARADRHVCTHTLVPHTQREFAFPPT
jgi:hypothetical protein